MKLITIGNCRFIKQIVTNASVVDTDHIIAKRLNRLGYVWMNEDAHETVKGGIGWQTVDELKEASIDKLRKEVLQELSKLNATNERFKSETYAEFVNQYRTRYYALVKNVFTFEGEQLTRLASRFDANRQWFFKDGKYYFREY